MASDEFDIIRRYFNSAALAFARPPVRLGIGDDCALLSPSVGMQLAMSMDILQEGVHFLPDADPFLLGKRSLLVNLSDLAAMGARPLCFTLGLCLPKADPDWLEPFSRGLAEVAQAHDCPLVGGDMSGAAPVHGSKTICIQVQGELPAEQAMLRSGARPGDLLYVTGTLGDAAAGLALLQGRLQTQPSAAAHGALLQAFYEPESRVQAGQLLREFASACIDLSDGLASDLGHILLASGVGALIDTEALPLSAPFRAAVPQAAQLAMAVGGGDDYELCFTLPAQREAAMAELFARHGIAAQRIGVVTEQLGMQWRTQGRVLPLQFSGYRHFSEGSYRPTEESP